MDYRTIGCDLDVKSADDGQFGIFKGYASTFGNVDRDDDVIVKGAFGRFDEPRKVKLLWQHNMGEPIGIWTKMQEDDKGLYVEGRLALKTRRGAEAYELMKMGALGDMSIGFKTLDSEAGRVEGASGKAARAVRRIKKIKLFEISVVTIPANPLATVDAVKHSRLVDAISDISLTEREFERRLRDAGVSRKMASIMVAEGFGGLRSHFESVLRDAAQMTCKDARTILDAGYRTFVAQNKQPGTTTYTDPSDDDDGHLPEAAVVKTEAVETGAVKPEVVKTGAVAADVSSDICVGQRDADGADISAKSTSIENQSMAIFLASLSVEIGTISR